VAKCWESRGCDDEMMADCPHNEPGHQCPAKCAFSTCDRTTHKLTTDPALIFEPWIDRTAAMKENCAFCEFFLSHGPHIPSGG